MGCKGGKAVATPVEAPTLLETRAQKSITEGYRYFVVVMDILFAGGCLEPTEDGTRLKIENVDAGFIGLWNNRPGIEKVKKGDVVKRLRKVVGAKSGDWVAGDAQQMLEALWAGGCFEMEIKRAIDQDFEPEAQVEPGEKQDDNFLEKLYDFEAPVRRSSWDSQASTTATASSQLSYILASRPSRAPMSKDQQSYIRAARSSRVSMSKDLRAAEIELPEAPLSVDKGCLLCVC